jgi:TolB-like protein
MARLLAAAGLIPPDWLRGLVVLVVAGYPVTLAWEWAHGAGRVERAVLGLVALLASVWILLQVPEAGSPVDGAAPSITEPRLVVLPLLDLDRRGDRTYADGVTDLLVEGLASVGGLEVWGRASATSFLDVNRDAAGVGAQLGGAAVLDGTVRRRAGGVRLSLRLLDAETGAPVWTVSDDTTSAGLYDLRDEVVEGVAAALGLEPGASTRRRLERQRTSPEALDLYMLGRFRWEARTDGDLAEATSYYHLAIEADSGFTRAWIALAEAYATLPRFTRFPPSSAREYGAAAARTALQLDPDAAAAHTALGEILFVYERDWEGARAHLERAVELDPGDAAPRDRLCEMELLRGNPSAARERCREARRRDPSAYRPGWLETRIARAEGDVYGGLRGLDSLTAAYPDFEPLAGERALAALLVADSAGIGGVGRPDARRIQANLATWFGLLTDAPLADSLAASLASGVPDAIAGRIAGKTVQTALARVGGELDPDPIQLAGLLAWFGEEGRAAQMALEALEDRIPSALGLGVLPEFRTLRARDAVAHALEAAGLPVS